MVAFFQRLCVLAVLLSFWKVSDAAIKCRESPLDVLFIAESSIDTGRRGFGLLMTFIKNVANEIGLKDPQNRISITLFNKEVRDITELKDTRGSLHLKNLLDETNFWSGGNRATNAGKALQYVADTKFTEANGRRADRPAVCVFIIEGVSSDLSEAAAQNLQEHCRIIVLGIDRPNYFELSRIASAPTLGHLKTLQTYLDLVRFVKWVSSTICKPPIAAMQLSRGRITHNSIQIVWDVQPYASKYLVHLRLSGKNKPLKIRNLPGDQNNVTFLDLTEGTSYSIDAWPYDVDGAKGPKGVIFLSSGIKVPKMSIDPLAIGKTKATITWPSARLRRVTYYITVRVADSGQFVLGTGVSGNRFEITKLRPGTGYSVELAAIYRGARSESDDKLIFFTVPDPPKPKTVYVTDRAVRLEWNEIKGATTYGIRTYDTETGGVELLVRVDETANTTFEVGPLLSGKRYKFTLTSKTKSGQESEESPPVFQRVAPSNPRKIYLESRTPKSINISWDEQEGVKQYMVQFKTTLSPDLLTRISNTTWFFAEGLAPGAMYIFKVFSVGEDSQSDTENPATEKFQTVPGKVDALLIQSITQNSVTLQWSKTRGATFYQIKFKDSKTENTLRTERVQDEDAVIDGLQTGIAYLITVAAVGQDDIIGSESDPQMVITLPAIPDKPWLTGKTNTTLSFQWDPVVGAIQYLLEIQEDGNTGPVQFRSRKTSYTFDSLKTGRWYTFSLRSVGSGGRINMKASESTRAQTLPKIPEKPKIIDLTASTVTVTWDMVRGATGYILNVRKVGKRKPIETRNITENEYRIVNLKGGESYLATVAAYDLDGKVTEESERTLVKTMPESPGKPRVIKVSSSTVTLEWDEVKGASGYVISISDKRQLTEVTTENTQFTVKNLKPSTSYSFGLYSVAIEGTRNEKESERVEAITAPSPPSEVRVINAGTTYIELAWNPVRGAVSYIIRYRSIGDDEGKESGELEANNPAFETVKNLNAGVIYEFSVISVGLDGSQSDPEIHTDGTLPATPDKPIILLIGSTKATLSWNQAKGALSYIVKAKADGFEEEYESNTTRVDIDGLESGTRYEFTVMSVGINGRVNLYESEIQREQTLTSAPTDVRITEVTTTTIKLAWKKMQGAVYYSVSVGLTDGTPVRDYMAFRTTYTIRRLEPGTEYSITVASIGTNFIESEKSDPLVATTVPSLPQIPQIVDVTSTTVELSWKPVKGAVSYSVAVREDDDTETVAFNVTESKIIISDLESGTWYEFFTYSVGAGDRMNSEPSAERKLQTVPGNPTNFTFVRATTTSITVSWDKMKGAKHYEVTVMREDESVANISTRDTSVTAWNLEPGTTYSLSVLAYGEQGRESESSEPITESTTTKSPSQPILMEATGTTVDLEWDEIPGAIRYIVIYVNRETNERKEVEVTKNSIIIQNLSPGTWYDFSVISVGVSEKRSEESPILDEQTVPVVPQNLQVEDAGMDYISLVWDESKGASSYRVSYTWRDKNNDMDRKMIRAQTNSIRLSDLTPGTDYEVMVASVGQTWNRSPYTNPIEENTIPNTPEDLELMMIEEDKFKIQWKEVKGATSYVVEITPEDGKKIYRETKETEWTEEGKQPGESLEVNVQSKDKKNRGNGVATSVLDIQTICQEPRGMRVTEIGTTSMKFEWNPMEGADFYLVTVLWSMNDDVITPLSGLESQVGNVVQWQGGSGRKKDGLMSASLESHRITPGKTAYEDANARFTFQTRSQKIEIDGLSPAKRYRFEFETVNKKGMVSRKKTSLDETTMPRKVEFVSLLGITENTAMLGWDDVDGAEQYVVNVTRQLNGVKTTQTTLDPTITLNELAPGSWYTARIFTVGKGGNMNYDGSDELNFQTIPGRPNNVKMDNASTTTIELSWDEAEGVAYYKVFIRLTRPFNVLFRVDETRTNRHLVENLEPGTRYLITVASVATGGRESRTSKLLVGTTTPAKPTNLRLMDISSTTATLQWDNVPGAFRFLFNVRGDDGEEKELRTRGTLMIVQDLIPGVWYDFWVRSVGQDGRVNNEASNIVRQQTIPESPGKLKIEEITTTTISLSWKKIHGIKQYQVFVEDSSGTIDVYNVTRSFYTLSQLSPGSSYSIYVIAVGTSGQNSRKSDTEVVATVPATVEGLRVVGVSTTHIELQWSPVKGATEYTIVMRNPDSGTIIRRIDTSQFSHIVTPLEPGTTYAFSLIVKGRSSKQSQESSMIQVQTTPLSPTDIEVREVTTSTIKLSWKAVPGVRLYKVVIRQSSNPDDIWRIDEVQKTEHTVSSLNPGSTYLLGVITVGTSGKESDSSELVAETTYPEKPTGLTITEITTSSISIKWNSVRGARHYVVHVVGVEAESRKELTVTELETTIPALSSGSWYDIYIVAVGEKNRQSEPSETLRDQTEPLPATNLEVTSTETTSISLKWDAVIGVKFYEVTITRQARRSQDPAQTFVSDSTEYTINELLPGVPHTIYVVGVATSGRKSQPSEAIQQTTVPAALDEVFVKDATATTITLQWSAVRGATSYTIVIRLANDRDGEILRTIVTTSTSFTVPALLPGESYLFSIRSKGLSEELSEESPKVRGQTVPLPPSRLQVTDVGTSTISLSWKAANGADFYRVIVRDGDENVLKTVEVQDTEHTVDGLIPGVEYTFTITAIGKSGRESDESSPISQTTRPNGPTGVTIIDVQTTTITVTWDKVEGVTSYRVIVENIDIKEEDIFDAFNNRFTIEGLSPGSQYAISVTSIGSGGQESIPSERVLEQTIPSSPSNIVMVDVKETSMKLRWDRVFGVTGYVVIMKDPVTGTETRMETIDNEVTINDLAPGTQYEFSVVSIGSKERMSTAKPDSTVVQRTVSSKVLGLRIVTVTATSVSLRWARSQGVSRYIIKLRDPLTGFLIESFDVLDLKLLVEDLQPGKNYSFSVTSVARNGKESEESDPVVVSTAVPSPGRPTVERITNSSVVLVWDEVEGAREYIVYYSDDEALTTEEIRTVEEFILISGLLPGYSYTFTVTAVGESGQTSPPSASATADTLPATPQITEVGEPSTDSITVSWDGVKGAIRYTVLARWQRQGERRKRVVNATTTETTLNVKLPLPGITYTISVRAEGKSGNSRQSERIEENTLPATPARPSPEVITTTSMTLSWKAVTGAASYEVVATDETTNRVNSLIVYRPFVEFTNLTPGTRYAIQLFSRDAKQKRNDVGSSLARILTVPLAPENVQATIVTPSSVTLTWDNVKGASTYEVTVNSRDEDILIFGKSWKNVNIQGEQASFQIVTTESIAVIDGLASGSVFNIELRAVNSQDRKSEPVPIEETTLPGTVKDLRVTDLKTDSATIIWSDIKAAAFYRVQYTGEGDRQSSFRVTQQPSVTLVRLTPGTRYTVSVVTYDVQNRTSEITSKELKFQTVPRAINVLQAEEVTTSSISISWRRVKGADTYEVKVHWIAQDVSVGHLRGEVPVDQDGFTHRSFQTPLTELNITQLDPGTSYWFDVTSITKDGKRSEPSEWLNETTLPAAIAEITLLAVTEMSISLSWDETKGALSYSVQVRAVREPLPPIEIETKTPELLLQDLASGVLYEIVVQPIADNGRQDSIESASIRVKTLPRAPDEVRVSEVTEMSFTVSWKPSRGALRYKVFVEFKDPFRRVQTLEFETRQTSLDITDLQPGDSYAIYVVAFGNRFEGSASKKSEILVQRTMLSPPRNLLLGGYGDDYITLSWELSPGATSYVINVVESDTGVTTSVDVDVDFLSYDVTSLEPGVLYAFTIQAKNAADNMTSRKSKEIQQRTRPSAPQSVRVIDVGAKTMEVEWNDVKGADTYTIYLTELGFTEQLIAGHPDNYVFLEDLSPGTEYRIQITAVTVEGIEGRRSERITQSTAPNAPGKPEVVSFTSDSVELQWARMKGATTYIITTTDDETGEVTEIDVGTTLTAKVDELQPGTSYSFTIRGENTESNLRSEESEPTTQKTYPIAPTVEVVSFSPAKISISWNSVKGAEKYTIFLKRAADLELPKEIKTLKETTFSIEELDSGTEYEIQVIAVTEEGLKSDKSLKIIQATAPNTPSGLEVFNVTTTAFSVSWFPASGATLYTLILTNMETLGRSRVDIAGDLLHMFTRLKPGTQYRVFAYAITMPDNTRSERSEIVETRTLTSPPRRLQAFDVEETKVSLEWRRVKGAQKYTVFINKVDDPLTIERKIKNLKKTEVTVDKLSPGTVYEFQVAGVTEENRPGKRSEPLRQQTVPAPPQDITMVDVSSTSFRVTWTKSEGATSYNLRLVNDETGEVRQRAVGNVNTTRFQRLLPGTLYRVTISAQRKEADVASRNSYRVLQRTAPPPPTNLETADFSTSYVALQWIASKAAVSYSIVIYEVNATGQPFGDGLYIDQIQDTYIEIIDLDAGTLYQFEVYAVNEEGLLSEQGAVILQQTSYLPPQLPASPDPLVRLSNVTSSSMIAQWDEITHADYYALTIRSDSEPNNFINYINETVYEITGLSANTEYTVTLIAVGRSGDETPESSPAAVATTLPLPPPAPTGLQESEVTDKSVLLTWNPSPRAISYEIELEDRRTKKKTVIRGILEPRYDIKNLRPGRPIVIRIFAIGTYERSRVSDELIVGAKHPIPEMLFTGESPIVATAIRWNSITLSYEKLLGAVSYSVIIMKDGQIFRQIDDIRTTRYTVRNLTEVTTYAFTYFGVGAGEDASEESDPPLSVTTAPHTPAIPTGVKVSDATADSAVVEWKTSDRAVTYDIVALDEASQVPTFFQDVSSPYTMTGLVFDTRYSVTVVAVGEHDRSESSLPAKFKTKIPKPGNIRLIFTQFVSDTEIWLLWSPATYAVSYTITVRQNGKRVQQHKEILGNSIQIKNLKPDTEYEIGIKPVGLEKSEGDEQIQVVTTLFGSVGQEEKDEGQLNEFGIDESTIDLEDEENEETLDVDYMSENITGPGKLTSFEEPETLEEALSSLVATMVEIPDDEIREDASGKQVIKTSSTFRTSLWKAIQTVRNLVRDYTPQAERKSDTTAVQVEEFEEASEAMEKLIILSRTLKEDPKSLRRSGPKKVAFEVAGLLVDIFTQSQELEDVEASGQETIQELMVPILEELLANVILGEFEVQIVQFTARTITVNWTGVFPAERIDFGIREFGSEQFKNVTTIDRETLEIKFVGLQPETEYEIIATPSRDQSRILASRSAKTKKVFATRPPTPKGLRVAFTARTYVSIRWQQVKRGDANIVYIVRLYRPRGDSPIQRFNMQKETTKQITKLKRRTSYEITVSSYDVDARKQSQQSRRIRVRTK